MLGLTDDLRPFTPEELAATPEEVLERWRAWGRAVMAPPQVAETIEFSNESATSGGRVVFLAIWDTSDVGTTAWDRLLSVTEAGTDEVIAKQVLRVYQGWTP